MLREAAVDFSASMEMAATACIVHGSGRGFWVGYKRIPHGPHLRASAAKGSDVVIRTDW